MKNKLLIFLCVSILLSFSGCRVESAQVNVKTNDTVTVKSLGTDNLINIDGYLYYDVGVKTINKFNPIPYSTLKNSYFVVYRRGLGNI